MNHRHEPVRDAGQGGATRKLTTWGWGVDVVVAGALGEGMSIDTVNCDTTLRVAAVAESSRQDRKIGALTIRCADCGEMVHVAAGDDPHNPNTLYVMSCPCKMDRLRDAIRKF